MVSIIILAEDIDAEAGAYVYGSYVDEPLMMVSGSTKSYFHANSLSSVAALTDGTGSVIERYRHDAYGNRTVLAADGATVLASSAARNQIGFTGLYEDVETGLLVADWRCYKPSLGRWISRDPLGYIDGMSLYAAYFVPNSMDPTGLLSDEDKAAVKKIVCENLPGKDTDKKEWAIRLFRDKGGQGGVVGGSPQPGGNDGVNDPAFDNSNPPAGTDDPSPIGELHTHPEPLGPSKGDFSRWTAKGHKLDVVVYDQPKCCKDGDQPGTGYIVYVFEWSSQATVGARNRTIHDVPATLNGLTRGEFNDLIDKAAADLEKNKQLSGYEKMEVCCPKK